jgi:hypothetical protein
MVHKINWTLQIQVIQPIKQQHTWPAQVALQDNEQEQEG